MFIQVAKMYFSCEYVFGSQFQSHSSQNPWNFLSIENDKVSCDVNEVTFGKSNIYEMAKYIFLV